MDLVCELSGSSNAKELLQSGVVYGTFEEMISAQGGDLSKPYRDPCHQIVEVRSTKSGIVTSCDAYKIGYANLLLGGGRTNASAQIHHGVGIRLQKKKSASVLAGDVLAQVFLCEQSEREEALELIRSAYNIV